MIEVALKLLICQVNTKLLKTIMLEIFEPKDVEDSNVEMR